MSRNKVVMIVCVIALAQFIYLGYQIFGNRGPVVMMEKEAYREFKETGLRKFDHGTEKGVLMEKSVRREGLNGESGSGNIISAHPPENGQRELKNKIKTDNDFLTKQNLSMDDTPGDNQNDERFNTYNDRIDLPELNRLLSQVGKHKPDAIRAVMNIATRTNDNRILHTSLQALGRLGTNEANQVLSNAVGKNLDNSIEVIRILSYFNRSVPLEDGIVNQLIEYIDSPSAPVETKRVIINKVIKSGTYGSNMAEELMEKFN